jgi:acyl carrier protein
VEVLLGSEIWAFIAQYLQVDIDSMNAHSHLSDDFGLDLFDITELMIGLEEWFGLKLEAADELSQIEFVGDLAREANRVCVCKGRHEARGLLGNSGSIHLAISPAAQDDRADNTHSTFTCSQAEAGVTLPTCVDSIAPFYGIAL